MNRRNFIKTCGISLGTLFIENSLLSTTLILRKNQIRFPNLISANIHEQNVELENHNNIWENDSLTVELKENGDSVDIWIYPQKKISLDSVVLEWKMGNKLTSTILNDHWERTYGDVSWHKPSTTEILPWYFMEISNHGIYGFGVKVGANAFCYWQIKEDSLRLYLDTRSGGQGVFLSERHLLAAQIVTHSAPRHSNPFNELRQFLKKMSDKARLPIQPIYGINDWYFSYGNNSEQLILEHTALIAPMTETLDNRPFSVIDAGWFRNFVDMPYDCCFGDMTVPNERFNDMGRLADKIRKLGMRPGIWTRPLCASTHEATKLLLPKIQGRIQPILDPTIPDNLERIKKYFKLYHEWGYELVKFDFTTYDILGKWGFEMIRDHKVTEFGWQMYDNTKTNAEIILNLYKEIREAATNMYLIGCNTISHLSAGIFELNRIGDDTSGIEWERTLKMGVNTLAFRGAQHGIFYAADCDCVGVTNNIPWDKNKQWMDLVAKSGTPFFISVQPNAVNNEQKNFIKKCLTIASQDLPIAEPIDWLENITPQKWKLNGNIEVFKWN